MGCLQLERGHTVSLHVRAEHLGGSLRTPRGTKAAAQAVLRAMARLYASQMGAIMAGDSLGWLQDAPNNLQTRISYKVDARVAAGAQMVRDMEALFEVSSLQEAPDRW